MSSPFAGVSIVTDGELWSSTVSAINAVGASGYHLLVVDGYSRTTKGTPTGTSIKSSIFMVGGHRWRIYYYPNGENPRCAGFVSLYVTLIGGGATAKAVEARFEFSFVDQVEKQDPAHLAATKACSFSNHAPRWGCDRFITRDALERSNHLRENCFTIRCDIIVVVTTAENDAGEPPVPPPSSTISHHLSNLLETKAGSDVTFEVCGETFAAHRCVLAARSRVFMAELFGSMREGTTTTTAAAAAAVIQIKDMEPTVFKAMLSFIYTDLLPPPPMETEEASDEYEYEEEEPEQEEETDMVAMWLQHVFAAADRYDLPRLKNICEERLSEHMGVSSVTSILALAEQHQCRGLKEACFQFLLSQSPESLHDIMASDDWNQMLTPIYPAVLNELLARLFSQYVVSSKQLN